MSFQKDGFSRRAILRAGLTLPALATPAISLASTGCARRLRFHHTHTNEKLDIVYCDDNGYRADALAEINNLLRDHRTGEVMNMDPRLLDMMSELYDGHGSTGRFEIISGYRSSKTNEMLRKKGGGGVAKKSLHMQGRAIDIRLTDVSTDTLRDSAKSLQVGGVGYYRSSDFIHVDTGRVRFW